MTEQCSPRDGKLDFLRGLTMLVVVLGHVIMYTASMPGVRLSTVWVLLENIVWTFHMPLFAYLSGWAMSLARSPDAPGFLSKRLRSVMLPYFTWTIVVLIVSLTGLWRSMAPVPGEIIGNFTPLGHAAALSLLDFFWFLPAIFVCYVMWWLASKTDRRDAWMITGAIAAIVLHLYGSWTGLALWSQGATWLLPFFAAGAITKRHVPRLPAVVWAAILGAFACGVWLLWPIVGSDPKWMPAALASWLTIRGLHGTVMLPRVLPAILKYVTAGLGSALFVGALSGLSNTRALRGLTGVGKRSLGIYLTHPFLAALLIGAGVTSVLLVTTVTSLSALALVFALEATRPTALLFLGGAAVAGNADTRRA